MAEKFKPEFIYHFTNALSLFKILPSMKLKMSKLEDTNDPRERISIFDVIYRGATFSGSEWECMMIIEDFLNTYPTITCFSGDNSLKKGFNLPTMWAHYSDNHKGICLKITTKTFRRKNEKSDCKFKMMNYLSFGEFNKFEISKTTKKEEIIEKLAFQKRDDWSSENEWRLFSLEGKAFCSIEDSLDSIILGLDFDDSLIPSIKKEIEGTSINIQRLKVEQGTQNFYLE